MDNNLNTSSIQKSMVKKIIIEVGVDTTWELEQLMAELSSLLGEDMIISWKEVD